MNRCTYCRRDIDKGVPCNYPEIQLTDNLEVFNRIPVGVQFELNCFECQAPATMSSFHHYGCNQEQCPRCKGQLTQCHCGVRGLIKDEMEKHDLTEIEFNELVTKMIASKFVDDGKKKKFFDSCKGKTFPELMSFMKNMNMINERTEIEIKQIRKLRLKK